MTTLAAHIARVLSLADRLPQPYRCEGCGAEDVRAVFTIKDGSEELLSHQRYEAPMGMQVCGPVSHVASPVADSLRAVLAELERLQTLMAAELRDNSARGLEEIERLRAALKEIAYAGVSSIPLALADTGIEGELSHVRRCLSALQRVAREALTGEDLG